MLYTASGSRPQAFGPIEWILMLAVGIIWGASFLLIDIGLEGFAPATITWIRTLLGFAVVWLFKSARRPVEKADQPRVVLLGITWVAIPLLIFPYALQHIESALAGMLNALVPIFAALISAALLRHRPRLVQATGISVGFVGSAGILAPTATGSSSEIWATMMVLVATLLYGLSINLAIPLQQRYGAPAVLSRALATAAIVTAPLGIWGLAESTWKTSAVLAIVALGLIGSGAAFVLMTTFVGRAGATRGGIPAYLIPVVAMILGVLFRNETITLIQYGGTALVLLGAYLSSRRETLTNLPAR